MRFKKLAAVALSTALIFGGTTGVAHAQSAAPAPSSEIPIPPEFVGFVTQFNVPADVAYAGLQIAAAWVGIGIGSSALSLGSSALGTGSAVLSSPLS